MALSWSMRRKLLYSAVGILVALVAVWGLYQSFFTAAPTCFDGAQNGDEQGVDCGGSCSLVCANLSHAPVVSWARAFEIATSTYTAAAYVENLNNGAGARRVPYAFELFDADNKLVIEERGIIDLPPVEVVPIVVPNIDVGQRSVSRALFAFGATPVWQKVAEGTVVPLAVEGRVLAPDGSRLDATIVNNTQRDAGLTTVAAVLFDAQGVARAASKSVLSNIPRKSQQQVVFTWPGGVPGAVRAEITVLPSF